MALLWTADYSTAPDLNTVVPPWTQEQEPNWANPATNRMTVVEAVDLPGTGPHKPTTRGMRVELHPYSASSPGSLTPEDGDVTDTSGYHANRAEAFARAADPFSTAAELWPDPVGTERWWGWSMMIPTGFTPDPGGTKWMLLTQWKQRDGGSPTISIEVVNSTIKMGGTRAWGGAFPNSGNLTAIVPDVWQRFAIGMFMSPDPAVGWLEAYVNGVQIIPRTTVATMDYQVDGITADPMSFKQGIYRASEWDVIHTAYYGPALIGEQPVDVGLAISPAVVPGVSEYWGARV